MLFGPKGQDLDICGQFCKKNDRFEIITFQIGYMGNFLKIRKLILFDAECLKSGIWAQNFEKKISDLKSAPLK